MTLFRPRGPKAALLFLLLLATPAAASFSPQTQDLSGEVVDAKGAPIQGAICTLTTDNPGILPSQGLTETTGEKGGFQFTGLVAGNYNMLCAAAGHEPVEQKALEITDQPPPFVQVALPDQIVVREKVEVREKPAAVALETASAPALVSSQQMKLLPLTEMKFKAALPLVPGVVRTPDGRISIKGSVETQGMLLVDSADTVDPVTGSFSIEVPFDAIESLEVHKTAYRAEYGRFSGGLTSIVTRPPSAQWHIEVNDFVPSPRGRSGHIVGIADNEPRMSFGGPLVKNRLNFSESFKYDLEKNPVRGLAWPNNEIKIEGFDSLTSFQYIHSPHQLITANFILFPLRHEFANISSLVPRSASSNDGQQGAALSVTDRYLFPSGGVSTTLVEYMKFDSYAYGQGPLDMLLTPNGIDGNSFNAWRRFTNSQEIMQTYQFPASDWKGRHEFKVGGDFVHRFYEGTSASHAIQILRVDGTLAEQIDFSPPAGLRARDIEAAAFVQDHWSMGSHVAADLGLRFSGQTLGEPAAVAPRGGLVISPGSGGKTIIRGGAGVFYDRLPLLAGDFTDNPTRTVTCFDPSCVNPGVPVTYTNSYIKVDEKGNQIVPSGHHLSSTPYNFTWNTEINQQVRPRVVLRLSYVSSRTINEFIIDPRNFPPTPPTLLLSNTGGSRYHEFESTVRFRTGERADMNLSYIWSRARGDLNTLTQIYVPFEQPVIRPNFFADLPSNAPHRVITWARFKMPWSLTASPLLDVHTGFPYSRLDLLQNYAGTPNGERFPTFLSLDMKFTKDFHIPVISMLKKYKLRGIFQAYNVTNHFNPRDVFANNTSPFFGQFVGLQHRTYDLSFDIVY